MPLAVANSLAPESENRPPDTACLLASRFWRTALGFWHGPSAWRAWLLTGLLIGCVPLQLAIQYCLNY